MTPLMKKLHSAIYDRVGQNKTRGVLTRPLFVLGLIIKLICSAYFASSFLTGYFIPFANYFITSHFSNPYLFFYNAGMSQAFPYPALMLYIISFPKLLFGNLLPDFLIYRLPLLLADTIILLILVRWLRQVKVNTILLLYWLSPLSIYISYMHGQLDVIPIAALFISIHLLFRAKVIVAFILLGLAVSTKTSVLLAYPFFVIYLFFHPIPTKVKLLAILASFVAFILPNIPYIHSPAFIEMIFNNNQQKKLFILRYTLDHAQFYFVPAAYFMLLFAGYTIKIQSRSLFIMFLGFAFGIIMLLVPPMQGWYFWILPFFCYFYANYTKDYLILFMLLQMAYLIYFGLIPQSDYFLLLGTHTSVENLDSILQHHGYDPKRMIDLSFTLLQSLLMLNCYVIYKKGISIYRNLLLASKPYLIGIAGNSGVGKTTLANSIKNIFLPTNTCIISGDDMHRWERNSQNWQQLTHLNPKANELHSEYYYLSSLKNGHAIQRKYYDHDSGVFKYNTAVKPNKLTIFEGLHPFYIKNIRNLFDLKIFLKPDESLSTNWKIIRDTEKRGYSKEKIMGQIASRKEDYEKYIRPQETHANIVIELLPALDNMQERKLHLTLDNTILIEPIVDLLTKETQLNFIHEYAENDKQSLKINGSITSEEIENISHILIPDLLEYGINQSKWESNDQGILQLILSYIIVENANREY